MSNPEEEHHRRLERHAISGVVEIYDSNRDKYLGRLVNIHHEGLMVMGDGELQADHVYQIDLQLPESIAGSDHLHLGIDCLWSRVVEVTNTHWAGCQIIDLSDLAREQINVLVERLEKII